MITRAALIVSALKISLLQQSETQTQAGFVVMRIFTQKLAKDFLRLRIVAFAQRLLALCVSLLDAAKPAAV